VLIPSVEIERDRLEWALDASEAPSLFFVWQEDPDNLAPILEICRSAHMTPDVVEPGGPPWFREPIQEGPIGRPGVVILPCGLSSIPPPERQALNIARERILEMGHKLVFVEPTHEERSLRRDFPDIFSIVRDNIRLDPPLSENDLLFDSGGACGLETLRRVLPQVLTHDSIVVIQGEPLFKAPPRIECPKGHGLLERGMTMITFQHAPASRRVQPVEGWVCRCGEAYVPGEIAREAHRRAFQA
jgi:hypothetical protein